MTSASSFLRPDVALAATAALSLLAAGAHCLACNDIGCSGGLQWSAAPDDGSTIVPGSYALVLVLDDTRYELDCDIAAGLRDSECSEAIAVDGEPELDIDVQLLPRQTGDTWDRNAPVAAIVVDAAEYIDDGRESSTRGPREVLVELRLGERVLLSASYDIDYERDDDFRGDERCGFCDELEQREAEWTP